MPRVSTKVDFIKMANENFNKMWKMISVLSDEEQAKEFKFDEKLYEKEAHWKRDKNLKDILIHLYEWHNLLIMWEDANCKGIKKPFLPVQYTWKTYGLMNDDFAKKHQKTLLKDAKEMLLESHKKTLAIVEKYSDEQLFIKAHFDWTGSTSLGQYFISATISHYDWAMKKLKANKKD